jgi:hypothetical protein
MPEVTVLISSFDGYSDCWLPVAHGFKKYWPDCPYPVLLMTNTKDFSHEAVSVLKVGGGRDWSGRMVTALERITTPYVMYFQEDYWISAPVDTARVMEYAALMEKHGLNYIRLLAFPEPDQDFAGDPRLGMIGRDASYRTSVQISLWRREVFRELVRPGESVWQFELQGTERSRQYGDTFLSVKSKDRDPYHHGISYVCTAINSGRWSRLAKAYAKQEGLAVDFSNLPSETWWDDFKRSGPLGAAVKVWTHRLNLVLFHPRIAATKLRNRLWPTRVEETHAVNS